MQGGEPVWQSTNSKATLEKTYYGVRYIQYVLLSAWTNCGQRAKLLGWTGKDAGRMAP